MFSIDRSDLLTGLLLVMLLAGCAEKPLPPSDPRLAWPITVTLTDQTLPLDTVAPDGRLTDREATRLAAFFDRFVADRRGRLHLGRGSLSPVAAERLAADIAFIARQRGLAELPITLTDTPDGPPHLRATLAVATGPDCRAAAATSPAAWPFGCAHQRNLAAMVQEPLDLIAPESLSAPDTARLMLVLEAFRKGDSTSSKRGESERLSVSKVSD